MDPGVSSVSGSLFRPLKKQKHIRKRVEEPITPTTADLGTAEPEDIASRSREIEDNGGHDISSILRLRKSHRSRKGGIEFSTAGKSTGSSEMNPGMTADDVELDTIRARFDRFTAHTGQKVDVDKHMYELMLRILKKDAQQGLTI
jgi:hypothetical protein